MRIAVIGAGVSGITSVKALLEQGLEAVCFERTERLGGIWNEGPGWPSYRSLVANVSREKTSLSDHALRSNAEYPPRADVHRWIEAYADRFDVRRHIRFGHEVRRVEPRWTVDGEPFDAVVVATGMFSEPDPVELPGSFAGRIIHSIDYDAPEPFTGQDVLVAGGGSSGIDIAVELARVARSVSLAVRGALVTTPKTVGGAPIDRRQTRWMRALPPRWRSALMRRAILGEWRRRGVDLARLPANVRLSPLPGRAPTPSEDLVPALVAGRIRLRPALSWVDGDAAVYADGTRDRADAIVLATGYEVAFPFLARELSPLRERRVELYRHVFHPDEPSLAFVGFTRVSGPVPPVAEMQARWTARVFAGKATLPSREDMRAEIAARVERARATGAEFQRVQYVDYLDELGALIGVKPRWWRDPLRYWFGTVTAEQYR